jgi:hypothetical protein
MNKKFLSDSLKAISGLASIISIHSFMQSITDKQESIKNSENKIKTLEEKLNNYQLDDLKNEVLKTKVEFLKINLDECLRNVDKEIGLLKEVNINNTTYNSEVEYHVNNYIKENEKAQKLINDFISNLIDKNKFIGGDNWLEKLKKINVNLNKFISQLSF